MSFRILLVEDEAEIADFIVRGLREEGFVVELEKTGTAGSHALRRQPWDLVLLDWSIPEQDGLTLLRQLRARGITIPVLFLTARDRVEDRVLGLDSGADDYLCKPFAFSELLARIRALLRRPQHQSDVVLKYADIEANLLTHRVERARCKIELTSKEEALLVYFLRYPNQVLSRTRIYEHLWDDRFDGVSNTLEVHIMELRRKLESHGSRVIHTIRGRGYLLGDSSAP